MKKKKRKTIKERIPLAPPVIVHPDKKKYSRKQNKKELQREVKNN